MRHHASTKVRFKDKKETHFTKDVSETIEMNFHCFPLVLKILEVITKKITYASSVCKSHRDRKRERGREIKDSQTPSILRSYS